MTADYECDACYKAPCPTPEACSAWLAEESDAEMRAEFAMSWAHGGGRPEDASAAFHLHERF